MMRKRIFYVLTVFSLLFIFSCSLYSPPKSREETFLKSKVTSQREKKLLVLRFISPGYDKSVGVEVAKIFHQEILRTGKLKMAKLREKIRWEMSEDEESEIEYALRIANEKNFDLLLLGWIDKMVYGKLTPLEIVLRVRLLSVKDKKTLFYLYKREVKESKEREYPLETRLSVLTPPVEYVLRDMAKEIIEKMFSSSKVKNFIKLWSKKEN